MKSNMKLWLLNARKDLPYGDNPWEPWYDKAFGFVVRAETEEQARQIAHENAGDENRGAFMRTNIADMPQPWLDSKYSQCSELLKDGEAGMVLQDFHAA